MIKICCGLEKDFKGCGKKFTCDEHCLNKEYCSLFYTDEKACLCFLCSIKLTIKLNPKLEERFLSEQFITEIAPKTYCDLIREEYANHYERFINEYRQTEKEKVVFT